MCRFLPVVAPASLRLGTSANIEGYAARVRQHQPRRDLDMTTSPPRVSSREKPIKNQDLTRCDHPRRVAQAVSPAFSSGAVHSALISSSCPCGRRCSGTSRDQIPPSLFAVERTCVYMHRISSSLHPSIHGDRARPGRSSLAAR